MYIVVKLVRMHIKMHTIGETTGQTSIRLIEITGLLLFYYGKWWQFPLVIFTRRMTRQISVCINLGKACLWNKDRVRAFQPYDFKFWFTEFILTTYTFLNSGIFFIPKQTSFVLIVLHWPSRLTICSALLCAVRNWHQITVLLDPFLSNFYGFQ